MNDPRERLALLDVVEPEIQGALDQSSLHRIQKSDSDVRKRIISVWLDARDLWGEAEDTVDFLFRRHPMLDDHRPIDVTLESEEGAQKVHGILGRLRFGSAA